MAEEQKKGRAVATAEPRNVPRRFSIFDQFDRDLDEMRQRMNARFRRLASRSGAARSDAASWAPAADAYVQDGTLVVKAELPGVKPEDIRVTVDNGVLTVEGERGESKETKEAKYYAAERFEGSFARGFALPDGVDVNAITATLNDGVLDVRVPLPAAARAEPVQIPVKN